MTEKPVRLDIKPSADLRRAIDDWRLTRLVPPSRAEAARRLIELGLRQYPLIEQPAKRETDP